MPVPMRWLLVLLMTCTVAPVSAERLSPSAPLASTPTAWQASDCPYERARRAAAAGRIATSASLTVSVPPEGSLFDPARQSIFAP